jgi:hypothetical protein
VKDIGLPPEKSGEFNVFRLRGEVSCNGEHTVVGALGVAPSFNLFLFLFLIHTAHSVADDKVGSCTSVYNTHKALMTSGLDYELTESR